MQIRNVPAIAPRYWTAISVASVLGANTGDFVAHDLHLGHARGLLPLAAVMTIVLLLERLSRRATEVYYWLAIVTVRTAATNLADLMTHDLRLGYAAVIAALAAIFGALLSGHRRGNPDPDGVGFMPATGVVFWATMLTAGTLGTALGDAIADELHMGVALASLLLIGVVGAMLAVRGLHRAAAPVSFWALSYWATIVAIRTAGTTVGDFTADAIGLAASLIASLVVLILIVATWPRRPAPLRA